MANISLLDRLSSLDDMDFGDYKVRRYTQSPDDWRDIVIYQLMTDRFNNPDGPPKHLPWDSAEGKFQGGTFSGIEKKLDYLQNLGVKAIWLSPVQQNCQYNEYSHHGYGIQDFLKIEPRFSHNSNDPEEELKTLINSIHDRDMYVIFDIVLNHGGDVFEYAGRGGSTGWSSSKYPILWRNENGKGVWHDPPANLSSLSPSAGVAPKELFLNNEWRRQGVSGRNGKEEEGDFVSLKELATDYSCGSKYGDVFCVRNYLIDIYKYLIAEFDVDGFRIDTLKYVSREFARNFGNAIREYALSIGKKNFLTYGEVWDQEDKISQFVGRYTNENADLVGVDSATDFTLRDKLVPITKGFLPPVDLVDFYKQRKSVQRGIISSHGEASRFFVTFIDNHDLYERYLYSDKYQSQLILALTCQFALQGIPCIYYGTEQGLQGQGDKPEVVRQALWGKSGAFDESGYLFSCISKLIETRDKFSELRYGRQYFREISGNGKDFGHSVHTPGVIAFSRILGNSEVVVVANCDLENRFSGQVLVDPFINNQDELFNVQFTNKPGSVSRFAVEEIDSANIDGNICKIKSLNIELQPSEVQILVKK